MRDLNMFSSTAISYGPDNYFVFSDINNGQSVYTIGYRISIYKVGEYPIDEVYNFKFIPPLQSVSSKFERPNNRGGRILVADNDDAIKNRVDLIRNKASKRNIGYYEINHEELFKDLVNLNIDEIHKFAEKLGCYNIPLNRDTFGYSIEFGKEVEDEIEDEFGNKDIIQTYDAWLGCMPDHVLDGVLSGYYEFEKYITTSEKDTKYMRYNVAPWNCYCLDLVDTYEITTMNPNNMETIEKLGDHIVYRGFDTKDALQSNIKEFFELRKCGVSLDFLFEFIENECVYQISTINVDCDGKQYGPLYGSRELY